MLSLNRLVKGSSPFGVTKNRPGSHRSVFCGYLKIIQEFCSAKLKVDNARSVALTADDAAEKLLRWLLRRKPRRDLPPSPVEGQPQTMYAPKVKVEGKRSDDDGEN